MPVQREPNIQQENKKRRKKENSTQWGEKVRKLLDTKYLRVLNALRQKINISIFLTCRIGKNKSTKV